ncbi:hypothetical protein EJB05_53599 [Eragrostis curvula]|uniref:Uncharacterized protein n=1 Tax=Eragrostis curvula TaxID=38414 RepID=A0A5J9SPK0_9POAL|nr:hypothetical protein EJB05_53599 [Eragrostis curvula]
MWLDQSEQQNLEAARPRWRLGDVKPVPWKNFLVPPRETEAPMRAWPRCNGRSATGYGGTMHVEQEERKKGCRNDGSLSSSAPTNHPKSNGLTWFCLRKRETSWLHSGTPFKIDTIDAAPAIASPNHGVHISEANTPSSTMGDQSTGQDDASTIDNTVPTSTPTKGILHEKGVQPLTENEHKAPGLLAVILPREIIFRT